MGKGVVDREMLRHIQQHAAKIEEDNIHGAYQKMRYKRTTRVEGGNLILSARLKKRMADMITQTGNIIENKIELSPEQMNAIHTAFESFDGHTLLAIMMGQVDLHAVARVVLEHKLAEIERDSNVGF